MVQRPSPESDTRPANFDELGSSIKADAVRSKQPGSNHAAPPPHLGDVGQVEVVLVVFGIAQRSRLGVDLMGLLADIGRPQ